MAKDPAFLFYTGDFSIGTQFFSDEQVGKYVRLLMAQHQHGHLTESQVNFICKSYEKEVIEKFEKDDKGLYFNVRLEIEINKRKSYSESRGNNRKGNIVKGSKKKIISKSYDIHMENENEDKNKDVLENKKRKKDEDFCEIIKSEFELSLDDFFAMRVKIKKPATDRAKELILKELEKLAGGDENLKVEILNQSILNNWQDVYQLKNKLQTNGQSNTSKTISNRPATVGGIPVNEINDFLSMFAGGNIQPNGNGEERG